MKIALYQMKMSQNMQDNLQKSLNAIEEAAAQSADLILFPEIQCCPFFPQYENAGRHNGSGPSLCDRSSCSPDLRRKGSGRLCKSYNRRWAKKESLPVYWIKDAGYNSNTDKPEEVNKIIRDFVLTLKVASQ